MLQYKKTEVLEGIDVKKTSLPKECELCRYCYFNNVGYKVEEHVCNGCHDLLTMV